MNNKILITIGLILLLSLIYTNNVFAVGENYSYYCINGISYQKDNALGGDITSIICQFSCSNDTNLNYHQNAIPQADLCRNYSDFEGNFIIICIFIVASTIQIFFYWISKKIPPVIRIFMWLILILAEISLLFTIPFPNYFNTQQTDILQILLIISMLISIGLGIYTAV